MRGQTFTSYINAEIPANTAQEFARLEQLTGRTFDRIKRQAQEATRATAGIVGGGGSLAGGRLGAGAAVNTRLVQSNVQVARTSVQTADQLRKQAEATARLERANSGLVRGLQATATTLNVVQGPLGPIAGRINALSGAVERLTGFRLGLAGTGAALFGLAAAGNKAAEIRSRLAPLYETQEEINREFNRTIRIARDAKAALDPVVELYSRLTLVSRDMNISQPLVEASTRAAAVGARLSGGSGQAQAAGLGQLAQGIGSNRLGGEELKSLLENTPRIAKAIADGLSQTENFGKVTIGTLRELGAEGELTAERVTRALSRSLEQLNKEAERMGPTWASATAAFSTEMTATASKVDQTLGLTRSLATGLTFVADNLREITALALGVAVGFGAIKVSRIAAETLKSAEATRDLRRGLDGIAQATMAQARTNAQTSRQRVEQLREQKAALEANIRTIALEKQQAQNAIRGVQMSSVNGQPIRPSAEFILRDARATNQLRVATSDLARTKGDLRTATVAATAASATFANVQKQAGAQTSLLRRGVTSLIGAINPLGIVVGLATTALLAFAFAESQAERNARSLEEVTFRLANAIDYQTGRILENNQAKIRGLQLDASRGMQAAGQNYWQARGQVTGVGRAYFGTEDNYAGEAGGYVAQRLSPAQRRAQQLFQRYERRDPSVSVSVLVEGLNKLAAQEPKLRGIADRVTKLAAAPDTGVVDAARKYQQMMANRAILGGDTSDETRRRAQGDFSGGRPGSKGRPRTVRELDMAAEQMRGRLADDRYAAQIQKEEALQNLMERRSKMSEDEYVRERAQILNTYDSRMQGIAKTEAAEGKRAARAAAAAERREKAEQARQARLAEQARDRADKLAGIMDRFTEDTPIKRLEQLADAAEKAKRELRDLIGESVAGQGTFSQEDYARREAEINAFVERERVRPITDMRREQDRELAVQQQLLAGRTAEAEALRRKFDLQDAVGDELANREYPQLLQNARAQERINDLLSERERIVSNLQGAVDDVRGSLEEILTSFATANPRGVLDGVKGMLSNFVRSNVRAIITDVMAGTDERVRSLINGTTKVDTAVSAITTGMNTAGNAALDLADMLNQAAARVGVAGGAPGTIESVVPGAGETRQIASAVLGTVTAASPFAAAMAQVMDDLKGDIEYETRGPQPGRMGPDGEIIVDGPRRTSPMQKVVDTVARLVPEQRGRQRAPSVREIYNTIGEGVGAKIDKALGTNFAKGVGKQLGNALQGASNGQLASSILGSLGVKQSSTAAAIGGALGKLSGIPGADIVSGAVWGTIGGAIKPAKRGSASIGGSGYDLAVSGTRGNNSAFKEQATGSAKNVIGAVNRIAEQLNATVNASIGSVSIGVRDGKFRVDPSGRGITKTSKGAIDFGKDEAAAIEYAVKNLIQDGVLAGISAASQRILQSGQDLERAISKAAVIESIPRRLMQLQDPVRFAVTELNREFSMMISYLKEGSATAEQFTQAEQLYNLERAKALESASNQARSVIQSFLDDMMAGPSSPLSRRTTYNNAKTNLDKFVGDINAGRPVDENALLEASRNFQEASRSLFGSSGSFFADFDALAGLLTKAQGNIGSQTPGAPSNLPPSPFANDPAVRAIIDGANGTTKAIDNQTTELAGRLDQLIGLMNSGGGGGGGGPSSIGMLPGFGDNMYSHVLRY